ncbi:MAG: NAD-dependent epimerase/dehydratase family protein [Chitinophagaceae bacterium]
MLTVAVTGAGGFVGQRFMSYKTDRYRLVPISLRSTSPAAIDLNGIDTIVHLAGKAHDMSLQDEKVYMDINFGLTKDLADHALHSGVRHFIYISTVKVYGEGTDEVLNESSACKPEDPYGKSKLMAEQYLQSLQTDAFVVSIVRPPVVYGPGVKGNIAKLIDVINKGRPLPLGNTGNRRSMVFLDNLIELIHRIIDTRQPGIFIPGDAQPLATDELIRLISKHSGKKSKLVSIPGFMRAMMRAVKPGLYKRLFGSFVIDNTGTNMRLGFTPPYSTDHGVGQMINWYKKGNTHERDI